MEQFGFESLSDDDKLELFEYMPIKARVRFARVNTQWANLLDRLWLSQKLLQFGDGNRRPAKCHPIGNDHYLRIDLPPEAMLHVISQCKNLKALKVNSLPFMEEPNFAAQLANVLNENCHELVHLSINLIDLAFFELFEPSERFTCIIPLRFDRLDILHGKNEPAVLLPLKIVCFEGEELVNEFALPINQHEHDEELNPMTWNLINQPSVHHLVARVWQVRYNELINLKSLIVVDGHCEQVGHLHQLEYVQLRTGTVDGLVGLLQNNLNLRSLVLTEESYNLIPSIATLGLNLKFLHFKFEIAKIQYLELWQNLARLTKLRTLIMFGVLGDAEQHVYELTLNVDGLRFMLEECRKLKLIKLTYFSVSKKITAAQEEQVRNVVDTGLFRLPLTVSFTSAGYLKTMTIKRKLE